MEMRGDTQLESFKKQFNAQERKISRLNIELENAKRQLRRFGYTQLEPFDPTKTLRLVFFLDPTVYEKIQNPEEVFKQVFHHNHNLPLESLKKHLNHGR